MLDYSIWKLEPFGYHLTSVFIHILNSCLVFFLVYLISNSLKLSLSTGLIFSVHTVLSEPVNYISSRADLLAAFFFLSSFIFYVKYFNPSIRRNFFYYIISQLCFLLALMSKEIAIVLPFLLCVYILVMHKDEKKTKKAQFQMLLPFFIILIVYAISRFSVLKFAPLKPETDNFAITQALGAKNIATLPISALSFNQRFFTSIKMLSTYVRLLILPVGLHKEWLVEPIQSVFQSVVLLSLVFICVMLVFAKIIYQFSKISTFGILWFFVLLVPLLNIYPLTAFLSEAWLYLPAVGFILFIVSLVLRFMRAKKVLSYKFILNFIFFLALICFSGLTIKRNKVWTGDLVDFYKDILKYNPYSALAHNNLGILYAGENKLNEAITEFQKTIDVDPTFIEAYNNLAGIYMEQDNMEEAISAYQKAISLNPSYAKALYNLGLAYLKQGSLDMAAKEFQKALKINPHNTDTLNNLGIAFYKQNKTTEAIEVFQRAIKIDPEYANSYYILASVYRKLEQYDQAKNNLRNAIELFYKQKKLELAGKAEGMLKELP